MMIYDGIFFLIIWNVLLQRNMWLFERKKLMTHEIVAKVMTSVEEFSGT